MKNCCHTIQTSYHCYAGAQTFSILFYICDVNVFVSIAMICEWCCIYHDNSMRLDIDDCDCTTDASFLPIICMLLDGSNVVLYHVWMIPNWVITIYKLLHLQNLGKKYFVHKIYWQICCNMIEFDCNNAMNGVNNGYYCHNLINLMSYLFCFVQLMEYHFCSCSSHQNRNNNEQTYDRRIICIL